MLSITMACCSGRNEAPAFAKSAKASKPATLATTNFLESNNALAETAASPRRSGSGAMLHIVLIASARTADIIFVSRAYLSFRLTESNSGCLAGRCNQAIL